MSKRIPCASLLLLSLGVSACVSSPPVEIKRPDIPQVLRELAKRDPAYNPTSNESSLSRHSDYVATLYLTRDRALFAGDRDYWRYRYNSLLSGSIEAVQSTKNRPGLATDDLESAAVNAMLRMIDRYSSYASRRELTELNRASRKTGAVNISVARSGRYVVMTPQFGSEAYLRGIRAGFVITKINGIPAENMSLAQARSYMHGEPGTLIRLTYRDKLAQERLIVLPYTKKSQSSVSSALLGGFGYIRISAFRQGTAAELRSALAKLIERNGGKISGVLLDLRGNSGGLTKEAIAIADEFLRAGTIAIIKERMAYRQIDAEGGDIGEEVRLVVLVDEGSASASELLAGSLKANGRAAIAGTYTFGKGTVPSLFQLRSGGRVSLTTGRVLAGGSIDYHNIGLKPDLYINHRGVTIEGTMYNTQAKCPSNQIRPDDKILGCTLAYLRSDTADSFRARLMGK